MRGLKVFLGVLFLGFVLVSLVYFEPELKRPFSFWSSEKESPSDWLDEKEIKVMEDKVIIDKNNVILSSFADTNSMDPLLDASANGLEIKPEKNSLKVGDVISYKSEFLGGVVIHRIIEISKDDKGTYYTVQGDNNEIVDPERVRFKQIEGVLIGVLY